MAFLLQDYADKELIILNDCPDQKLEIIHPQIKVFNHKTRFDSLGNKLHWMLQQAQGEYICRWDDDDISLPSRLGHSVERLMLTPKEIPTTVTKTFKVPLGTIDCAMEWRPENHWYFNGGRYFNGGKIVAQTKHPGNTHIAAIWHRSILGGATYPGEPCPSGLEDQTFTSQLRQRGYPYLGELLPKQDIFYLYRWGVSPVHLSGKGGGERMQQTYTELGGQTVQKGAYTIRPRWYYDYVSMARTASVELA